MNHLIKKKKDILLCGYCSVRIGVTINQVFSNSTFFRVGSSCTLDPWPVYIDSTPRLWQLRTSPDTFRCSLWNGRKRSKINFWLRTTDIKTNSSLSKLWCKNLRLYTLWEALKRRSSKGYIWVRINVLWCPFPMEIPFWATEDRLVPQKTFLMVYSHYRQEQQWTNYLVDTKKDLWALPSLGCLWQWRRLIPIPSEEFWGLSLPLLLCSRPTLTPWSHYTPGGARRTLRDGSLLSPLYPAHFHSYPLWNCCSVWCLWAGTPLWLMGTDTLEDR